MYRLAILLVVLAVSSNLEQTRGNTTVIDFGPGLPGAPVGLETNLTNQLASLGVIFSTPDPRGVSWYGPAHPFSDAQYSIAAIHNDFNAPQSIDPIRVDFSTVAINASIRGFDGGGDTDVVTLDAYDASDTLVDSTSLSSNFGVPGSVLSVSASEIAYVIFQSTSASDAGVFFDDLTYTLIPEPSTLALALMGLVLNRQVYRRRSTSGAMQREIVLG